MEKKNSIIMAVLVTLLILIIIGLVGYICYNAGNETKKSNNPSDKGVGDKVDKKELDLSKSLNTSSDITYSNASKQEENLGLSMSINSDKKSITLSIDWPKFCSLGSMSACSPTVETYQITGFSKNIKSTFIGTLGQSVTGTTLFYLMEDGTVEYTSIYVTKKDNQNNVYQTINYTYDYAADGKITGEHFVTQKLSEVNGIIKLYNVNASNGAGWLTTIGAKADGSFYDLGHIISK